jgi:hypothetical protein
LFKLYRFIRSLLKAISSRPSGFGKFSWSFALCAIACAVLSGSPSNAGVLELLNEKTSKHVEIPGTGAWFIPAPGLSVSGKFDGFASEARKIDVVVANIKSPFAGIARGFNEPSLLLRGVELKSTGEMTVNGARALLLKALHKDGESIWGKWIMLLENGSGTIVVNAIFVSGDADAAADLEVMLKSVYPEPEAAAAPDIPASVDAPDRGVVSRDRDVPPSAASGDETSASGDLSSSDVFPPSDSAISSDIPTPSRGEDYDVDEAFRDLTRKLDSEDNSVVSDDATPDAAAVSEDVTPADEPASDDLGMNKEELLEYLARGTVASRDAASQDQTLTLDDAASKDLDAGTSADVIVSGDASKNQEEE